MLVIWGISLCNVGHQETIIFLHFYRILFRLLNVNFYIDPTKKKNAKQKKIVKRDTKFWMLRNFVDDNVRHALERVFFL